MNETYETIADWAVETFNGAVKLNRGVKRAWQEFDELIEATVYGNNINHVAEEMADVIIVLAHTAQSNGIDLQEAINNKMAINRKRDWTLHGDGTAQHVR